MCSQIPDHAVSQGFVDEHCFMPAHPLCRFLPTFAADRSRGTDGKTCNKFYKKHPVLTPGILTLFCAHTECIGFSLMTDQRGPTLHFIYNRFKTAPKMIVYDNACNLHRYVLRRAPQFFSSTLFRIDRLHIRNHDGCSSGYDLRQYPASMLVSPGCHFRTAEHTSC
ncbi:TPA: hypothetical protein ACH3X1_008104 [Trebouxia sp. C0004]